MLYVHKGGKNITLDEIRKSYTVPTTEELIGKRPSAVGSRWAPVHHADLIDALHNATSVRGLEIEKEAFALSEDTHSVYGFLQFKQADGFKMPGQAPVLGFRSDNLQRFKLLGVSGSRVFICDNGAIVGDFVFGQKHTTNRVRDLDVGLDEGMDRWQSQVSRMGEAFRRMQEMELTQQQSDHLLMEAVRNGDLNAQRIARVDQAWRDYLDPENPHHEAFADRNAWSLYNAVTETAKGTSPVVSERLLKNFPRTIAKMGGFDCLLDKPVEELSLN